MLDSSFTQSSIIFPTLRLALQASSSIPKSVYGREYDGRLSEGWYWNSKTFP